MNKRAKNKKYSAVRRASASPAKRFRVLPILIVAGVVGVVGFSLKKHPEMITKISSMIAERHAHMHQEKAKTKTIAQHRKKVEPEPIHFEFYTALPNMHVKPSQAAPDSTSPVIANKTPKIVDAEELEKELSKEVTKKSET